MNSDLHGIAWKFGDDMNTDIIHAPNFFSLENERVREGLFHNLDPGLQSRMKPGDIIVAGRNFGCGSSRETVIRALKLNQIAAIVACDFARIFFRSATNNALPCLTFCHSDDIGFIEQGDQLYISLNDYLIWLPDGKSIPLEPVGTFIRNMWDAGGLLSLLESSDAT